MSEDRTFGNIAYENFLFKMFSDKATWKAMGCFINGKELKNTTQSSPLYSLIFTVLKCCILCHSSPWKGIDNGVCLTLEHPHCSSIDDHKIIEVLRLERTSKGPSFHGKESLDEIIWHPVQLDLENLQGWGLCHILGEGVPVSACSYCKTISFLCQDKTYPSVTCTCCSLSSPRGALWRERPHLLSSPLNMIFKHDFSLE